MLALKRKMVILHARYEFYLYECRECQARFATPFIANFHIREGICRHEDGDLRADGNEALIAVNLDDIEFSSFCTLQNAITKCTQDMLLEQKAAIEKDCKKNEREATMNTELPEVYGSLNRDSQAVRVSSSPYTTRVIADGLHRRRVVRSELDDRPQKVRIRDDGASVIHRQESVERTTTDSWRTPRERRIDDGQLHAHGSAHLEPWDRRGADAPELIVRRSEMRNEASCKQPFVTVYL
nr:unnamed protein product [Haemonchus contortus]